MNKVLFDLTPAQNIANGSAIYTEFIFKRAIQEGKIFDVFYDPSREENKNILDQIPNYIDVHKCSDRVELDQIINNKKYNKIFLGNDKNINITLFNDITPILVIHDLRFIEVPNDKFRFIYRKTIFSRLKQIIISLILPKYDSFLQRKRISIYINNPKLQIITVSQHTKYSLLLNFPHLKQEQIHVLYCPYPEIYQNIDTGRDFDVLNKFNVELKEYFLLVSANRWFKNSYRAIKALDNLITKKLLKNKKILVLGMGSAQGVMHVDNPGFFIFRNYVDNEELQCVYRNAYTFIYPSLQEGFGIPPLEAMQYGTPVLASSTSAINEICQKGADYFNPYSIMEIENRILHILNDASFYKLKSKEAKEHSEKISIKQKEDLGKLMQIIFD